MRMSLIGRVLQGVSLVALGVILALGAFMTWIKWYPSDEDPKNIDYVLWTHGLNKNMNLDHAVAGMAHDAGAANLVKGLSKDQIKDRFGYTLLIQQATPYLQGCYKNTHSPGEVGTIPAGKDVIYLRDSPWMVILDSGRAVDLVLCKGY